MGARKLTTGPLFSRALLLVCFLWRRNLVCLFPFNGVFFCVEMCHVSGDLATSITLLYGTYVSLVCSSSFFLPPVWCYDVPGSRRVFSFLPSLALLPCASASSNHPPGGVEKSHIVEGTLQWGRTDYFCCRSFWAKCGSVGNRASFVYI